MFLFFKKNNPVKRTYTVTIFGGRNPRKNIGEKIDYIILPIKAKFKEFLTIIVRKENVGGREQKQIIIFFFT